MSFHGVSAAAVVGYRSAPDAEEEVRAFIELEQPVLPEHFDFAALIQHCGRNLAYFMVPRFIDLVHELPRTALGKIQKQALKETPATPATYDAKAAAIEVDR